MVSRLSRQNEVFRQGMKEGKPVFGTTEWAASNVNYLKGCSNDCKYCFSKEMAIYNILCQKEREFICALRI